MEYVKREPIKGASGREPTAFTMKTIKELLAEDAARSADAETMRTPLPKSHVQQPPHMQGPVPVVPAKAKPATRPTLKASAAPRIDADITAPPQALPKLTPAAPEMQVEIKPAPAKKSLLGRLIGG
ncbi:hypothetical protein [uncultured Tateyamaria sp.]|uniref:hypothetical protein n=1 Tax=Tateyamaria sp. 1078 TaxID=3417464 RepID=UPI0026221CE8|nr:hypothetical protein [uncultured Tateyamaria sp.]